MWRWHVVVNRANSRSGYAFTLAALMLVTAFGTVGGCGSRTMEEQQSEDLYNRETELASTAVAQGASPKDARATAQARAKIDPTYVALAQPVPTRTPNPDASTAPLGDLWLEPAIKEPTAPPTATRAISFSVDSPPNGTPVEVFRVGNVDGVLNGGTPTQFTLTRSYYVTELFTYHWNYGNGTAPGTVALQAGNGRAYGPWQSTLVDGVYFRVTPNLTLPAGNYTIIDSDPATWAFNAGTNGQGMAWMMGVPAP